MSYIEPTNLASCYSAVTAHMYYGLESILKGDKEGIPKGILASMIQLLQLAHNSFIYDGFVMNPDNMPHITESLCARMLIIDAYINSTGETLYSDMNRQEHTIRDLLYLTKNINFIQEEKLGPQKEEYEKLLGFYKCLSKIAEEEKSSYPQEYEEGRYTYTH